MNIPAVEPVLARLHTLAQENPALRQAATFYQGLIPAIHELGQQIPPIAIDPVILRQKISTGTPLLVDESLEFDTDQTRHIFRTICSVINGAQGTAGENARSILRAVDSGALDPLSLLTANDAGELEPVEAAAARLVLDLPLLNLLAQNTLNVFLRSWRATLEGQVNLGEWRRAACPFCGAAAGLAEIRGIESTRYLRCLRCGAGWPYPHLCCAFCGNEDHRTLGVLLVEDQIEKPYLHICDRCHRYIKTVVSFEPISPDMLLVAYLATLSLDSIAAERGYG